MRLTLERVGRIYSWNWVIRDVSTMFSDGQIVCVLGANGVGKSTLLKLIAGILRPTTGSVQLDGRKVRLGAVGVRRRMMFIEPDQPQLCLRPVHHLGAAISLYRDGAAGVENTAAQWIEEFGIQDGLNSDSARYSRGERMKLWLTTLFTIRPELWLLDEPHQCGLDARGIEILESQIQLHRRAGGIVIFTSQWPPHARRLADRVLVLSAGILAFDGKLDDLINSANALDPGVGAILRSLENSGPTGGPM